MRFNTNKTVNCTLIKGPTSDNSIPKGIYPFEIIKLLHNVIKYAVCEKKTISSITMQDIINATGLSQGAIYRYYKNIDEILADLLSRIHIEQYESVDRLNEFIDMETKQIVDLHSLPITPETIERRRRLIAKQIESLYNAWAEELQNFLYPHKRIELEFLILANNFPERARAIFPNVAPSKDIDNRIVDALTKEIEDGVITPKISLEEFMEYNASVFEGIVGRAISENCLKRNRDFDESNSYDIKKRFETFAHSSLMFLGIDELFKSYNISLEKPNHHFMIADATGRSVVMEYTEDGIVAFESSVVTNFDLYDSRHRGVGQDRYNIIENTLKEKNGILSEEEALDLLASVVVPGKAQYSTLYNLTTGEVHVFTHGDNSKVETFELKMVGEE